MQELVSADTQVKHLYTDLFQRSQYRVGELWESQRISVAVEHLATAITERMLTLVHPQVFSGTARNRTINVTPVVSLDELEKRLAGP